jgi:hypothetical protein
MKWIVVFLCAALAGCTGSQTHLRMLEQGGDVRIDPTGGPGYDSTVFIRNTVDFGYDPDDKATRYRTALQMVETQCPRARVVAEKVAETGTSGIGIGRGSRTYALQIKCVP